MVTSGVFENLPINHAEGPILVPLTDISCSQPSILREDALIVIKIISLIVPFRDRRTPDANLALRAFVGREVTCVGNIEQLDLDGGHG